MLCGGGWGTLLVRDHFSSAPKTHSIQRRERDGERGGERREREREERRKKEEEKEEKGERPMMIRIIWIASSILQKPYAFRKNSH